MWKDAARMINPLVWLLFGTLVGLLASRVRRTLHAPLLNNVVGSMGSLDGGVVFWIFDTAPLQRFTVWGLVYALIDALAINMLMQIVVRRSI
jgi:uncharacterized membrane protein YeaQ/YmgE (transglycosylase-associated protein family)